RTGDRLDLIGEYGAGIEQHAVVGNAGDDGRVARAQPRGQGVGRQVSGDGGHANERGLEFRSRKRAAAYLGLALDEFRIGTHGSRYRLSAPTYLSYVFVHASHQ